MRTDRRTETDMSSLVVALGNLAKALIDHSLGNNWQDLSLNTSQFCYAYNKTHIGN